MSGEPPRCDCGVTAHPGSTVCFDCMPTCSHGALIARLRAFATDCVTHGDMTPMAKRMLERILNGEP